MTIFNEERIRDIKESMKCFIELSDDSKKKIVDDLRPLNPTIVKNPAIGLFLKEISFAARRYTVEPILEKLTELNFDKKYSKLLVTNMKIHLPTLDSLMVDISTIDNTKLSNILPKVMQNLLNEPIHPNDTYDLKCTNIELNSVTVLLYGFLNDICSGEDINSIKKRITVNFDDEKFKIVYDVAKNNMDIWHKVSIFRMTIDIGNIEKKLDSYGKELNKIKKQLEETDNTLRSRLPVEDYDPDFDMHSY